MENIARVFLWTALTLVSSNCDDGQEVERIDSLGARLVAYDEQGNETAKFEAQTNITFGLSLTNKGNVDVEAGTYFDYCNAYEQEDFLLIYKLVQQDNGEENWMPYGKPYQEPIACPTILTHVIVPAKGQTKILGATWNNVPNNPPFTAGKYYTAFTFNLELDGKSRKHELKLEFEVL